MAFGFEQRDVAVVQHRHLAERMNGAKLRRAERAFRQLVINSLLLADHAHDARIGRAHRTDDLRFRHGPPPAVQPVILSERAKKRRRHRDYMTRAFCEISKGKEAAHPTRHARQPLPARAGRGKGSALLVRPRSAAAPCAAKSAGAARPVCCPCARAASGGRRFRARRRPPSRVSPATRVSRRRNRRPSRRARA